VPPWIRGGDLLFVRDEADKEDGVILFGPPWHEQ
jgi:hypothetical protein